MSVEFYITKELTLEIMLNDFINIGKDKICNKANLPNKFYCKISDFNTIMLASSSNYTLYICVFKTLHIRK